MFEDSVRTGSDIIAKVGRVGLEKSETTTAGFAGPSGRAI